MDRISNMPDVVIEQILESLPLNDAIKMSILSKAWKDKWTKMPSLMIDKKLYQTACESKHFFKYNYLNIINSIILQHNGPIHAFSLFIPNGVLDQKVYFCQAIQFILRGGVKRLTVVKEGSVHFDLPFVFSYVQLTHLRLKFCKFNPPSSFEGFPNLVSLKLESTNATADTISRFIAICPKLRKVTLQDSVFLDGNMYIHAHNLEYLHIQGKFRFIWFHEAPNLKIFDAQLDELAPDLEGVASAMFKFFECTPQLEHLLMGGYFCKLLGTSECTLTGLDRLMGLYLSDIYLHDVKELSSVLSLIGNSPNLCKLDISLLPHPGSGEPLEFESEVEKYMDHNIEHLQSVTIFDIKGKKTEMKIIECLLCRSPALKLMYLQVARDVDINVKLKISTLLLCYHRASPEVEIRFAH